MGVVSVEPTELFVGSVEVPLQVVRVAWDAAGATRVYVDGQGISTPSPVEISAAGHVGIEVAVDTGDAVPGARLPARLVIEGDTEIGRASCRERVFSSV